MSDVCSPRRSKGGKGCKIITFKRGKSGHKLAHSVKVCRCDSAEGKFKSAAFKTKMRERMKGHGTTLVGKKAKGVCFDAQGLFHKCWGKVLPGHKLSKKAPKAKKRAKR